MSSDVASTRCPSSEYLASLVALPKIHMWIPPKRKLDWTAKDKLRAANLNALNLTPSAAAYKHDASLQTKISDGFFGGGYGKHSAPKRWRPGCTEPPIDFDAARSQAKVAREYATSQKLRDAACSASCEERRAQEESRTSPAYTAAYAACRDGNLNAEIAMLWKQ